MGDFLSFADAANKNLDDLDEKKHRTFQIEQKAIYWQACVAANGQRYLALSGESFPSLPGAFFGLILKADTTAEEAEALTEQMDKFCPAMFAQFYFGDELMEGLSNIYEIDPETGLAKLD
jgi:hypothetical protein